MEDDLLPVFRRLRTRSCASARLMTWPAGSRQRSMARAAVLFSQQHEEGYWCGELEADTTLESDYILLHTLLGTGNPERFQKCCNYILASPERRRRMADL